MSNVARANSSYFWEEFQKGFDKIYSHGISKSEYFKLYTIVHNHCAFTIKDFTLSSNRNAQLYVRLGLYLEHYLENKLKGSDDLLAETLLQFYGKTWKYYTICSKVLNGVCSYLNRNWIHRDHVDSVDFLEVYNLALDVWKTAVLCPLKSRIARAILELIEKERYGETINSRLISVVLTSYVEIGIKCTGPHSERTELYLYQELFETDFLADTEIFYANIGSNACRNMTVIEFMKEIESWILSEEKRTQVYLHESTLELVMHIIEQKVIKKYYDVIYPEFKTLLAQNRKNDLARMFNLFSRIEGGLKEMKLQFEDFVHKQGLHGFEKYCKHAMSDTKLYMSVILETHQRYNVMVITVFGSDNNFMVALDNACGKFINQNPIKDSGSVNLPEMLAKHCDHLIRKKTYFSHVSDLENNLNQALIIFKHIEEKDIFHSFYNKLFAKRLVQFGAEKDEVETFMILKLKQTCGFDYTAQLRRMFQDIFVSRDLSEEFKKMSDLPVDFSINIINSFSWPFTQRLTYSLPHDLEKCVHEFYLFYCNKYNSRRLHWLHGMSRAEVISNCYDKPYTLQTSAFQMAVLLQFNSSDAHTTQHLQETTGIRLDILLKVLQTFVKLKLLKTEDMKNVAESSTLLISHDYKNKKLQVNINRTLKSEIKSEEDTAHKNVDDVSKLLSQATIV